MTRRRPGQDDRHRRGVGIGAHHAVAIGVRARCLKRRPGGLRPRSRLRRSRRFLPYAEGGRDRARRTGRRRRGRSALLGRGRARLGTRGGRPSSSTAFGRGRRGHRVVLLRSCACGRTRRQRGSPRARLPGRTCRWAREGVLAGVSCRLISSPVCCRGSRARLVPLSWSTRHQVIVAVASCGARMSSAAGWVATVQVGAVRSRRLPARPVTRSVTR